MIRFSALRRVSVLFLGFWFVAVLCMEAEGVVLHPDNEPNLLTWSDRPVNSAVGRWGNNSSCIAIAPNYIITTRHQGGGMMTPVTIDGVTYTIDKIINHPGRLNPTDETFDTVDLRVVKLKSANLQDYAEIYTGQDETSHPGYAVIAGFGLGREAELKTDNITYGYSWQNRSIYRNFNLRFATNIIFDSNNNVKIGSPNRNYNLDLLYADFGEPGDTIYEGSISEFDSGGGWFILSGGKWKLAALNWGTENAGSSRSIFRNSEDPNESSPEIIAGLRLSSYADWIINTVGNFCSQYPDEDFNGDCVVNVKDLAVFAGQWLNTGCNETNNFCQHADITRNGEVNLEDFWSIALEWTMTGG